MISEHQKELDRLEENCRKIDKYFDTALECLNYCEEKIVSLTEEMNNLEDKSGKFSDIINSYDEYNDCFKDYISSTYGDYFTFMVFEVVFYLFSVILIIQTPVLVAKIVLIFMIIIATIFNFFLKRKVIGIKKEIKENVYKKYDIDLESLTDRDVDNIEMCLLKNKVRVVKINKEIDEYEFYIQWKNRELSRLSK